MGSVSPHTYNVIRRNGDVHLHYCIQHGGAT